MNNTAPIPSFIYVISYDLNKPEQHYLPLRREIESLGNWKKPQKSVYFVKTSLPVVDVSKRLNKLIDGDDLLFICPLVKFAGGQMQPDFWQWFNSL